MIWRACIIVKATNKERLWAKVKIPAQGGLSKENNRAQDQNRVSYQVCTPPYIATHNVSGSPEFPLY